MGRRVGDIEIGAALGGIQESLIAREGVGGAEAVERPGQPARPRRVVAPALVGRLP